MGWDGCRAGLRLCGVGGMWDGLKLVFLKLMCSLADCGYTQFYTGSNLILTFDML